MSALVYVFLVVWATGCCVVLWQEGRIAFPHMYRSLVGWYRARRHR